MPIIYEIECEIPDRFDVRAIKDNKTKFDKYAVFECNNSMRFKKTKQKNQTFSCVINSLNTTFADFSIPLNICERIECPLFNSSEFNANEPTEIVRIEGGKLLYNCKKQYFLRNVPSGSNFEAFCVPHDDSDMIRTLVWAPKPRLCEPSHYAKAADFFRTIPLWS